jgi:hypothetical protein
MVKAWPILASDEFAEACHQLEFNASGCLDGTDWVSLTWDKTGALLIRKQIHIEEKDKRNGEIEIYEESDMFESEDPVGILYFGQHSSDETISLP